MDETFSSANGEFDSVEPGEDILFPSGGPVGDLKELVEAQQAQINELTGRIDDLQAQLDAIKGQ